MPPDRHVFAYGDHIFVSPNSPDAPVIDNLTAFVIDEDTAPRCVRSLRYSNNAYPFLGYIPTSLRYSGPLLQRLSYSNRTLPIVRERSFWRLSPTVVTQWSQLETALQSIIKTLLKASRVLLPLDFQWFKQPSAFGYQQAFPSDKTLRRLVFKSRDAFIPLLALCSFAISMTPNFTLENPPWAQVLERNAVHPQYIQEIKASSVADFSDHNKRVGVIVRPDCQWLDLVARIIGANVPVWLCWDDPSMFTRTRVECYRPTLAEVVAARMLVVEAASEAAWVMQAKETEVPSTPPPPAPNPGTRQLRGETFEEFFARQAVRHAQKIKNETAQEREKRLNRESAAATYYPGRGRSGPDVFIWEEVDGYLLRERLFRGQVASYWGTYSTTQRRYNGFENEWDLAIQFDSDTAPDDDYDFPEEDDDFISQPATPLGPPPYPPASLGPPDFAGDLADMYDTEVKETMISGVEMLEDVLYYCYGFNWHDVSYDAEKVIGRPSTSRLWIDT
jgi:hypothetical protein